MSFASFLVLGASLASWALLLVTSRVILFAWPVDPWLFTLIQMMAGGIFLIAIAGRGKGFADALSDPFTWLYGGLRVATAAFFTAALTYTSTYNAAFLGIVSVPISLAVLWLILSRQPSRIELPGHCVVFFGFVFLAGSLDDGWRNPAIVLMILSELCVVASTLIAEFHPLNQTSDTRQRARLTGIMLLASAFVMLILATGFGFVAQWLPDLQSGIPETLTRMTDPSEVFNPALWISATLVGVVLRGPSLFLALKAIHHVRTEKYIAAMAGLPFLTFAMETLAVSFGWLAPSHSTQMTVFWGSVMTFGSLSVLIARSRKETVRHPHRETAPEATETNRH
ncbi:hypothetical protein IWQ52_000011 [Labrenzia sp. EL_159]|nr:hypothetical protein [Labrenzia sp. EL_162]MBG6192509.1 hypothetical protein [Labrenzia sp. EL_159]